MRRTFRSTFLAGLLMCLPLLVTAWTIQLVFGQVEGTLTPWVQKGITWLGFGAWLETAWVDVLAPVISVATGVVTIWTIGLVASNVLGRRVLELLEGWVLRVPLVRTIYGSTRQFIQAFAPGAGRSFSRVVLVEYPRRGTYTLGLVTGEGVAEITATTGKKLTSVFLPTTPNPISGWLTFVPTGELVTLTMSVDDAFKLIVSGGVLSASSPQAVS